MAPAGHRLTVGGLVGLLSQVPGGELLDANRSKRFLVALGGIVVAVSAFVIALWPSRPVVFAALVLQGLTGGLLGPAIAPISLALVGRSALADRLGRNQSVAPPTPPPPPPASHALPYSLSYQA